jgi:hypothetical protein
MKERERKKKEEEEEKERRKVGNGKNKERKEKQKKAGRQIHAGRTQPSGHAGISTAGVKESHPAPSSGLHTSCAHGIFLHGESHAWGLNGRFIPTRKSLESSDEVAP